LKGAQTLDQATVSVMPEAAGFYQTASPEKEERPHRLEGAIRWWPKALCRRAATATLPDSPCWGASQILPSSL